MPLSLPERAVERLELSNPTHTMPFCRITILRRLRRSNLKLYSVGINNYWHTASLHLEEVPAGLRFLMELTMWICDIFPSIPLPKIKFRLKNPVDYDCTPNNDGWTNLNEWFGDTQSLFHLYICEKVSRYVWRRTKFQSISIPYEFAKERFPKEFREIDEDYDYWSDKLDIEFRKKTKRISDFVDAQFRDVYSKLDHNYIANSL